MTRNTAPCPFLSKVLTHTISGTIYSKSTQVPGSVSHQLPPHSETQRHHTSFSSYSGDFWALTIAKLHVLPLPAICIFFFVIVITQTRQLLSRGILFRVLLVPILQLVATCRLPREHRTRQRRFDCYSCTASTWPTHVYSAVLMYVELPASQFLISRSTSPHSSAAGLFWQI